MHAQHRPSPMKAPGHARTAQHSPSPVRASDHAPHTRHSPSPMRASGHARTQHRPSPMRAPGRLHSRTTRLPRRPPGRTRTAQPDSNASIGPCTHNPCVVVNAHPGSATPPLAFSLARLLARDRLHDTRAWTRSTDSNLQATPCRNRQTESARDPHRAPSRTSCSPTST
jgi:hypothetical protein